MFKIGIINIKYDEIDIEKYDNLEYDVIGEQMQLIRNNTVISPANYDLLIITESTLKKISNNMSQLLDQLLIGRTKLIVVINGLNGTSLLKEHKWFPLTFGPSMDPFYDPYDLCKFKAAVIYPKQGSIILSTDRNMGVMMACSQRIAICIYTNISLHKLGTLMLQGPMPQLTPAMIPTCIPTTRNIVRALFLSIKALRVKIPRPVIWIIINQWYFAV